ncbi:MAG TPA: lactate utilization protein B [Acidimicrobiia bacterium]|nr:lactate utilization protein B [Acidimicrobiia bacterium]
MTTHLSAEEAVHLSLADRARRAIDDPDLQTALSKVTAALGAEGTAARTDPEMLERRRRGAAIRREVLGDLDGWLGALQEKFESLGITVHRAFGAEEARQIVRDIARAEGVRLAVKSKSMATEEIHLNAALEADGVEVVETDLGEYIIQLAGEMPSHIIAPAVHKTVPQVARLFTEAAGEPLPDDRTALCAFARQRLRSKFLAADMGITGVNFAAVDTGTIVLVTNEGNGRMCTSLPRVHVAVMPVEKVIPRFEDLGVLLPLLTRTATGQRLSTYVSMITGPRRPGEVDGPEKMHVVFLDHNRRSLLGTPYEEMLCCIRCGACLNVCPVYRRIGGHAYDAVYSGPMGAVLTPLLSGGTEDRDLPDASSLCGACSEVCPVGIPLADLLVRLRADLRTPGPAVPPAAPWPGHEGATGDPGSDPEAVGVAGDAPGRPSDPRPGSRAVRRIGFGTWARLWANPTGYRLTAAAARRLGRVAPAALVRRAPLVSGWGEGRDIPLPAARSFRRRLADRAEDGW